MWERGKRKEVLDQRRGKKTQSMISGERDMWNGYSEMRERRRERNRKK
jgi:hypothetical protein